MGHPLQYLPSFAGIADSPGGLVFAASTVLQAYLCLGDAFNGVNNLQQ